MREEEQTMRIQQEARTLCKIINVYDNGDVEVYVVQEDESVSVIRDTDMAEEME